MQINKIVFIHNTAMWYRRTFFMMLNEIYNIEFIFTHIHIHRKIYNIESFDSIEWIKSLDYKILKNYFNIIKPHGIAFGMIIESLRDYDLVVGGSWDSISEVIETIIFFTIAKLRKKPIILFREDWGWKRKNQKKYNTHSFCKNCYKKCRCISCSGNQAQGIFYFIRNPT